MIDALLELGVEISVYDPEAMDNVQSKYGDKLNYASSMYEATHSADMLIISTEWSIFRTPNFNTLKNNLKEPIIFDGRNLYDIAEMANEGFHYISIGRKTIA